MTASLETRSGAWAWILPFLEPIRPLLLDAEISDIMVNGESGVFIERQGRLEPVPEVKFAERSLRVAACYIARALGDEIGEEKPLLDSRLPDGSRVAIILAPVAVNGTTLTIRKFQNHRFDADELIRVGTLTRALMNDLKAAVLSRMNILISGGTGTGKTTLLNALAAFIPDEERLIIIEDTSEIHIPKPNVVRLEARSAQPGLAAVPIRELFRASLRMRPDRILLGEVRGGEAFDLLQAVNTGHAGTLSTIHATTGAQALTRLSTCVMMSGVDLPHRAIRSQIADGINLVVHTERRPGHRRVAEVLRVKAYDPLEDRYELECVYTAQ